ncbi:MAG: nucleotidyltransferase domain-containing protein [Candidatus Brocadia sp.]|nr:nucleotidyltransferase domain-containing protein [Candidatus Brocadia sp.]
MGKLKPVNKHKIRREVKRNQPDKISQEFANNVRKKLGNHVKEIILFGSRARGDFAEGSDYDLLIVLDERKKAYEKVLLEIGVDFLNRYNVLIGDIIYDEKEWELRKPFPLGLNIMKEGIEL